MKIWKFVIGILLFIVPIGMYHTTYDATCLHTPLGTFGISSGDVTFTVFTFDFYSDDGRLDFWNNRDSPADAFAGGIMILLGAWMSPVAISLTGIYSTITLFAIALYVLCSIIDNRILNLVADIVLIGVAVISLLAHFDVLSKDFMQWEFGIPIMAIVAGIVGVVGVALSAIEISKPKRRGRKKK